MAPTWLVSLAENELPAINAGLNATAATLCIVGWRALKRGNQKLHASLMAAAMGASVLFLACYVLRASLTGTHRFSGPDALKWLYYAILFTHMPLAILTVPLVGRVAWLAKTGRLEGHRPLARMALPIWLYVSVTGVLIYVMLYHVSGH